METYLDRLNDKKNKLDELRGRIRKTKEDLLQKQYNVWENFKLQCNDLDSGSKDRQSLLPHGFRARKKYTDGLLTAVGKERSPHKYSADFGASESKPSHLKDKLDFTISQRTTPTFSDNERGRTILITDSTPCVTNTHTGTRYSDTYSKTQSVFKLDGLANAGTPAAHASPIALQGTTTGEMHQFTKDPAVCCSPDLSQSRTVSTPFRPHNTVQAVLLDPPVHIGDLATAFPRTGLLPPPQPMSPELKASAMHNAVRRTADNAALGGGQSTQSATTTQNSTVPARRADISPPTYKTSLENMAIERRESSERDGAMTTQAQAGATKHWSGPGSRLMATAALRHEMSPASDPNLTHSDVCLSVSGPKQVSVNATTSVHSRHATFSTSLAAPHTATACTKSPQRPRHSAALPCTSPSHKANSFGTSFEDMTPSFCSERQTASSCGAQEMTICPEHVSGSTNAKFSNQNTSALSPTRKTARAGGSRAERQVKWADMPSPQQRTSPSNWFEGPSIRHPGLTTPTSCSVRQATSSCKAREMIICPKHVSGSTIARVSNLKEVVTCPRVPGGERRNMCARRSREQHQVKCAGGAKSQLESVTTSSPQALHCAVTPPRSSSVGKEAACAKNPSPRAMGDRVRCETPACSQSCNPAFCLPLRRGLQIHERTTPLRHTPRSKSPLSARGVNGERLQKGHTILCRQSPCTPPSCPFSSFKAEGKIDHHHDHQASDSHVPILLGSSPPSGTQQQAGTNGIGCVANASSTFTPTQRILSLSPTRPNLGKITCHDAASVGSPTPSRFRSQQAASKAQGPQAKKANFSPQAAAIEFRSPSASPPPQLRAMGREGETSAAKPSSCSHLPPRVLVPMLRARPCSPANSAAASTAGFPQSNAALSCSDSRTLVISSPKLNACARGERSVSPISVPRLDSLRLPASRSAARSPPARTPRRTEDNVSSTSLVKLRPPHRADGSSNISCGETQGDRHRDLPPKPLSLGSNQDFPSPLPKKSCRPQSLSPPARPSGHLVRIAHACAGHVGTTTQNEGDISRAPPLSKGGMRSAHTASTESLFADNSYKPSLKHELHRACPTNSSPEHEPSTPPPVHGSPPAAKSLLALPSVNEPFLGDAPNAQSTLSPVKAASASFPGFSRPGGLSPITEESTVSLSQSGTARSPARSLPLRPSASCSLLALPGDSSLQTDLPVSRPFGDSLPSHVLRDDSAAEEFPPTSPRVSDSFLSHSQRDDGATEEASPPEHSVSDSCFTSTSATTHVDDDIPTEAHCEKPSCSTTRSMSGGYRVFSQPSSSSTFHNSQHPLDHQSAPATRLAKREDPRGFQPEGTPLYFDPFQCASPKGAYLAHSWNSSYCHEHQYESPQDVRSTYPMVTSGYAPGHAASPFQLPTDSRGFVLLHQMGTPASNKRMPPCPPPLVYAAGQEFVECDEKRPATVLVRQGSAPARLIPICDSRLPAGSDSAHLTHPVYGRQLDNHPSHHPDALPQHNGYQLSEEAGYAKVAQTDYNIVTQHMPRVEGEQLFMSLPVGTPGITHLDNQGYCLTASVATQPDYSFAAHRSPCTGGGTLMELPVRTREETQADKQGYHAAAPVSKRDHAPLPMPMQDFCATAIDNRGSPATAQTSAPERKSATGTIATQTSGPLPTGQQPVSAGSVPSPTQSSVRKTKEPGQHVHQSPPYTSSECGRPTRGAEVCESRYPDQLEGAIIPNNALTTSQDPDRRPLISDLSTLSPDDDVILPNQGVAACTSSQHSAGTNEALKTLFTHDHSSHPVPPASTSQHGKAGRGDRQPQSSSLPSAVHHPKVHSEPKRPPEDHRWAKFVPPRLAPDKYDDYNPDAANAASLKMVDKRDSSVYFTDTDYQRPYFDDHSSNDSAPLHIMSGVRQAPQTFGGQSRSCDDMKLPPPVSQDEGTHLPTHKREPRNLWNREARKTSEFLPVELDSVAEDHPFLDHNWSVASPMLKKNKRRSTKSVDTLSFAYLPPRAAPSSKVSSYNADSSSGTAQLSRSVCQSDAGRSFGADNAPASSRPPHNPHQSYTAQESASVHQSNAKRTFRADDARAASGTSGDMLQLYGASQHGASVHQTISDRVFGADDALASSELPYDAAPSNGTTDLLTSAHQSNARRIDGAFAHSATSTSQRRSRSSIDKVGIPFSFEKLERQRQSVLATMFGEDDQEDQYARLENISQSTCKSSAYGTYSQMGGGPMSTTQGSRQRTASASYGERTMSTTQGSKKQTASASRGEDPMSATQGSWENAASVASRVS